MSDLVLSNEDILAQLAAEFNIETEIPQESNNRVYNNFTVLPGIRVLKSSWQGAKTLEWNVPEQDEIESFGRNFPYVNEIQGFIINSEIQAGLEVKNNKVEETDRETKTLCSVVGFKKGNDYIRELPEKVLFTSMYGDWDTVNKKPLHTLPHKELHNLGWLGSRGKSCVDCITSGDSTKDWQGNEVGECKLKGRIFMYVTHLISYFKENGKLTKEVKSVQELLGEPGFLLMISLPTVVGLKGRYDKNEDNLIKKGQLTYKEAEKTRQCYLRYLTNLYYTYKNNNINKINPKFVCTNISIKPPMAGEQQPKNYLTFEEIKVYDISLLKNALVLSKELFPNHSSVKGSNPEILDDSNWVINGVGGGTMYASAKLDNDYSLVEDTYEIVEKEEDSVDLPF